MASEPQYRPITADEFLAMDFGSDRKFELNNGVIRMMTGGSSDHAPGCCTRCLAVPDRASLR